MSITDILIDNAIAGVLYIASALLYLLYQILSLITFAIPNQINLAIQYFTTYFGYVKGFIDIETLFIVAGIYVNFLIAFYTWKIIRWVWAHIPWVGRHKEFSKISTKHI